MEPIKTEKQIARKGFVYLDLSDPYLTPLYRPHPASEPEEAYLARLNCPRGSPNKVSTSVEEVYKLITRKRRKYGPREQIQRKSDNKNLAVIVKSRYWIEKFKHFYE